METISNEHHLAISEEMHGKIYEGVDGLISGRNLSEFKKKILKESLYEFLKNLNSPMSWKLELLRHFLALAV